MDQLRSYSAGICVCHQRPKAPHDGLQTRLDQDGCFPSVPWVFRGKAKMSEKQANNRGWTSFIAKRYSKDILESVYIQSKLPYHILLQSHTTENDAQCENFKTSENLCWQMCPLSNKCIFLKKDFNTKLWTLFKKNVQCSVKKKKISQSKYSIPEHSSWSHPGKEKAGCWPWPFGRLKGHSSGQLQCLLYIND